MVIVDANIVLRYLLDDHPVLSPKAADILEQHSVTLPIEAACEVVYVLQKVYKVGEIAAFENQPAYHLPSIHLNALPTNQPYPLFLF